MCERGTICQLKVCNRSIEKGKGFDLRGYISVATKEIRRGDICTPASKRSIDNSVAAFGLGKTFKLINEHLLRTSS